MRQLRRFDPHFMRYPDRIVFAGSTAWLLADGDVADGDVPPTLTVGRVCDEPEYERFPLGDALSSESEEVI